MKKLLSIVLAALMAVSLFTACGAKSETAAPAESQAAASDSTSTETAAPASSEASSDATSYTIGICNYVDDASLNQIVENIQTRLAAIGEEKGVTFNVEYDNCNADSNLMSQIRKLLCGGQLRLTLCIARLVFKRQHLRQNDVQRTQRISAIIIRRLRHLSLQSKRRLNQLFCCHILSPFRKPHLPPRLISALYFTLYAIV